MDQAQLQQLKKFRLWIDNAGVGSSFSYHVGCSLEHCLVVRQVQDAIEAGKVTPFQKRLGAGLFEYIVVRVSTRTGKLVAPRWKDLVC